MSSGWLNRETSNVLLATGKMIDDEDNSSWWHFRKVRKHRKAWYAPLKLYRTDVKATQNNFCCLWLSRSPYRCGGWVVAVVVELFSRHQRRWTLGRLLLRGFASVVTFLSLVAASASVVDTDHGAVKRKCSRHTRPPGRESRVALKHNQIFLQMKWKLIF